MKTDKGVDNKIVQFLHCAKCLKEIPKGVSPMDWARNQFGWTLKGFQIWCNRHEMNVGAFDLQGNKVGYDMTTMAEDRFTIKNRQEELKDSKLQKGEQK